MAGRCQARCLSKTPNDQLTGVEMSYNCFPPGFSMPFCTPTATMKRCICFSAVRENSWWMARRLPSAKVRWCASPPALARLPQHGRGADVFYCLAGEAAASRPAALPMVCPWASRNGRRLSRASVARPASASVAQQRIQPDIGDARNLGMQAWHQRFSTAHETRSCACPALSPSTHQLANCADGPPPRQRL